jgi:protein TonB
MRGVKRTWARLAARRTVVNRRSLRAVVGVALLASCAGRGKAALEPRIETSRREPAPASAKASSAKLDQGYDLAPIPIRITEPRYPATARESGVHGTVVVEFVIDTSGRVPRARVLRSIPGLDAAAIDCVKTWQFKPALRGGKAVETTAQAPVKF